MEDFSARHKTTEDPRFAFRNGADKCVKRHMAFALQACAAGSELA